MLGLETAEDRHVFGSFLSREAAFKLMCSVWSQAKLKMEHFDEIDTVSPEIEIFDYSIEDDSSSISGNENFSQVRFKEKRTIEDNTPEIVPQTSKAPVTISATRRPSMELKSLQDVVKVVELRRNSKDESISIKDRRLLIFGMILAILLAMFSSFLLLKINNFPAEPDFNMHDFSKVSVIRMC